MEIKDGIIRVNSGEIATPEDRQKIEGDIASTLRTMGVLIDPSDVRSPVTIAEDFRILKVMDRSTNELQKTSGRAVPTKIKRMPDNGSFA